MGSYHRKRSGRFSSLTPIFAVYAAGFLTFLAGFSAFDVQKASATNSGTPDTVKAEFSSCHSGGGYNCVVDGDTFWSAGEKVRIADIDTPETHPARCAEEDRLGRAATDRLQALLNAGSFSLEPIDRDTDRYGRKLRRVVRNGRSIGDILVAEGLARPYSGGTRSGWCA
jgi:micrococcal nuclease